MKVERRIINMQINEIWQEEQRTIPVRTKKATTQQRIQ